jgi:hypothetical protein
MGSALLVPIHLDALNLTGDLAVTEGVADFSKLPYFDGTRDVNPETAYLSESVVATPFHDENLILKAGMHLHWALPDALTRAAHTADGTTFPAVPTRWLVTRSRLDNAGNSVAEQRWVVESDYLYPAGEGDLSGAIAFPSPEHLDTPDVHPFRFVGRQVPLTQWLDPNHDGERTPEYLGTLTSAGYGHPAFAALYPNCHSVFGFHDPDPGPLDTRLQYDVIGWYGSAANDHLGVLLRELVTELGLGSPADLKPAQLIGKLAEECGWIPRAEWTRRSPSAAAPSTRSSSRRWSAT